MSLMPLTGAVGPYAITGIPSSPQTGLQGLLSNPLFGVGMGLLSANAPSSQPVNYAQGVMGGLQMSQQASAQQQRQAMQQAAYQMQMRQLAQQQQEWEAGQADKARMAEAQAKLSSILQDPSATPEQKQSAAIEAGYGRSVVDQILKPAEGPQSSVGKLAADMQAADPTLTPQAALAAAEQKMMEMKKAGASSVTVNAGQPVLRSSDAGLVSLTPTPNGSWTTEVVVPKKPTEGEAAAGNYATRMQEASSRAAQIEGSPGFDPTNLQQNLAGRIPVFGNYAQTPEYQTYEQAKEDWVRAKLRKESGAVIAKEEMQKEFETYWPMPGDSPQKIAAKAEARRVAEQGMSEMSGPARPKDGEWQTLPNGIKVRIKQ